MPQLCPEPGCLHLPMQPKEVVETPATGCLHPAHDGYFATPGDYMRWYQREGPVQDAAAPTGAPAHTSAGGEAAAPRQPVCDEWQGPGMAL